MKATRTVHTSLLMIGLCAVVLATVPYIASAEATTFRQLTATLIGIINQLVTLLAGVAVLVFFWGIVKYLFSPGGEGYESGRAMMFWGVIALFVLFAVFGLTQIFTKLIRGDAGTAPVGNPSSTSGSITTTPIPPP